MQIILVEDEYGAAQNLRTMLKELVPEAVILAELDSVAETVEWLNTHPAPALGFFDIRLADGSSFEVFEQVAVDFPVVFTTAYEEFAIQAFKVNSIDYLLKPINQDALAFALEKYKKQALGKGQMQQMLSLFQQSQPQPFRQSFLLPFRDQLIPLNVTDCAYFMVENAQVYVGTFNHKKLLVEQKLELLEAQLDPQQFFRANRQWLISRRSITAIHLYFNGRLLLELHPPVTEKIIISKARCTLFKEWMNR